MTAIGHHLPLAVTFGFLLSRGSERLLFDWQIEAGNFRTRPQPVIGRESEVVIRRSVLPIILPDEAYARLVN
jgi:hypothetical protein